MRKVSHALWTTPGIGTIGRRLQIVWHRGDKFYCPFCSYKAQRLAWIGADIPVLREHSVAGARRRRGGCFRCGSKDRHRLIYAFLSKLLPRSEQSKLKSVLHFAPERCLFNYLKQLKLKNYKCVDINPDRFPTEMSVEHADILSLPFSADAFDLVLCNHIFEHIDNDIQAMKEVFRVLAPGGVAVMQVPMAPALDQTLEDPAVKDEKQRLRKFGQADRVRLYGKDYIKRLEDAGFTAEQLDLASEFPVFGLDPTEMLHIGMKAKYAQ